MRLCDAQVVIAGLGLMGGSLALALRGRAAGVIGIDTDPHTRAEARRRDLVNRAVGPEEMPLALGRPDLLVLATPLGQMAGFVGSVGSKLRAGAILTDLGSVKGPLIDEMDPVVPPGVIYIPGHPMAGSERQGIGGARADLYRGAVWMLACEPPRLLAEMIDASGAEIRVMPPADHDRIVAHTSHLPYLAAAAAAAAACEGARGDVDSFRALAAGGFQDTTRVAAGSVGAGADMCLYNRARLLPVLDRASEELGELASCLRRGDRASLVQRLCATREQLLRVRGDLA